MVRDVIVAVIFGDKQLLVRVLVRRMRRQPGVQPRHVKGEGFSDPRAAETRTLRRSHRLVNSSAGGTAVPSIASPTTIRIRSSPISIWPLYVCDTAAATASGVGARPS